MLARGERVGAGRIGTIILFHREYMYLSVVLVRMTRTVDSGEVVDTLIDQHIASVREQMRQLRHLERQLKLLRSSRRRANKASDCGILRPLAALQP